VILIVCQVPDHGGSGINCAESCVTDFIEILALLHIPPHLESIVDWIITPESYSYTKQNV
jgi:hypothetical protein